MKTAKQIINSLPEFCWATLLVDKSMIKIKAGESGYYPLTSRSAQNFDATVIELMRRDGKTNDMIADELNSNIGISKAQRAAMENGSLFGWHIPAADPENYDEAGKFILSRIKQTA